MADYFEEDFSIEKIDPAKAFEYLQLAGGNRELKKPLLARYTLLMRTDKFPLGDGVLIFNKDGKLRNGFHRLNAVIASGKTITFMVRRNADNSEDIVYDSGAMRTPADAMAFDAITYKNCMKDYFPIVRMAITDGYNHHYDRDTSNTSMAEFIDHHKEELDFIWITCFKERKGTPKGVSQSSVLAVFLLMLMHGIDREKIRIAAQYLIEGDTTLIKGMPGHQSLAKLRDYLLSGRVSSAGGAGRTEVFSKTQNMLNLFIIGEEREKVRKCVAKLPYPCLDYVSLPKLEIDPQLQFHLISLSKQDGSNKLTAKLIAERIIANGFKVPNAKNSVNTVSKRISTIIRRQYALRLDLGVVWLVGIKADHGNRVTGYQFLSRNHDFGLSYEPFNEAEFIERAREAS